MGQILSQNILSIFFTKENAIEESSAIEDYGENTGLFLNGIFIPPEILTLILSHLDAKTLINSTKVCKSWNEMIIENVWKLKAERLCNHKLPKYPAQTYQQMCIKEPFNKNLIKNPCGGEWMSFWDILENGGDKFTVENIAEQFKCVLNEIIETGDESCFATSYGQGMKQQIVDIIEEGLPEEYLDQFQPPIYIADWYSGRVDNSCKYGIDVALLDKNKHEIDVFTEHVDETPQQNRVANWNDNVALHPIFVRLHSKQLPKRTWNKVEHTFSNYGPGIRYICFNHSGQDKQFWKGHHGTKLTGSTVKILNNSKNILHVGRGTEFSIQKEKREIYKV